jgi:hypothetical protein
MSSFGFVFSLPPVGASDVSRRELTVTVNGGDPPLVRSYDGQPLQSDEYVFADKDHISVTLVDIDGAGNRSPSSAALSFDVIDDVPPPAPGDLGIGSKRQMP